MSKMNPDDAAGLIDEMLDRVFAQPGFLRLTLRDAGEPPVRLRLRALAREAGPAYQFETQRGTSSTTVVLEPAEARAALARRLRSRFRDVHLVSVSGDLHLRRAKRGRLLSSRSRPMARPDVVLSAHDRIKAQPLTMFDASHLLRGLDFTDAEGHIRASMQAKYRQVNAFLDLLTTLVNRMPANEPLHLVDGGCGKAYLTFAACVYLRQALGRDVHITGLDRNAERIGDCLRLAEALELSGSAQFLELDIADYTPDTPPQIVVSLHACDTATDAILAGAVRWGARAILAAPCCQHSLHDALKAQGPLRGLLRHGLLRQRFGDLLTDALRAQLLRLAGYRVTLQEFVDPDATARNLLIRAERAGRQGQAAALADYLALRQFCGVEPELESLLDLAVLPQTPES